MTGQTHGWPPGSRTRTLDLDGPVHLTEYGARDADEVMVCLHGLGGSALNFGLVAPALAGRRRILVPDLLAHGRSHAPASRRGAVDAQLAMLQGLLADECRQPVTLVGHSMGGILAILHAARWPSGVRRLVLIDPPTPNPTRWSRDPRLSSKAAFLRLPGMAGLVTRQINGMSPEQLVARQLTDATPYADAIPETVIEATAAEVRESRGEDGGRRAQKAQFRAIVEVVDLLARPAAWRRTIASVRAPTLWLQGEDDPLARVESARALAASRPDWTLAVRPHVGHLPHLEDPLWTTRMMAGWLDHDVEGR